MKELSDFSQRIELPNIPEGPGIGILEDEEGKVLQIFVGGNIRQRVGSLLDSTGVTSVHGPKVYGAMMQGVRLFVRWKKTVNYDNEKTDLLRKLTPLWSYRENPLPHLGEQRNNSFSTRNLQEINPNTNRGKVFNYLKSIAPEEVTNTQIGEATQVEPHQQVFMITQELMNKRLIRGRRIGKEWFFRYD